ncbi:YgcG family protein [Nitrosomonas sp. JL21]|uniref:TPM domain-containing protein n=1 Tax=Nitrosomonas sp. JL21 TaxID=153949 RepID=UPI00136A71D9|nr:YgcG family protein [Nitrosomonas sp. JL21]MBL8498648.1 YgcG family protein [Nitrosomonas sp.]MCC7091094.1 YgcG family protein [Nitrosomonas sp.]MXS79037.1 YgcG family protein [Nitrosomonas sp. JL21]
MIVQRFFRNWARKLVFFAILWIAQYAWADSAIPQLKAHVTDLTATLSIPEMTRLEQKLIAFEQKKGSQIAVLIVPTTQPETIEQYSMRVVESWKLGRKNTDDGVLLLVAKNDHALRIEVGYSLEGVLPDATAKQIIDDIIVPQFKAGHFGTGIDAGIDAIVRLVEGEPLPPPPAQHGSASSGTAGMLDHLAFIAIGLIAFGRVFQSLFGRFAGAAVTSVGAGFVGWLLFSSLAAAIVIAILAFAFGLFQSAGPGIYRTGRGGHYWGGDSGRGGGFGGGFGGGGGGFGGGGASGRW